MGLRGWTSRPKWGVRAIWKGRCPGSRGGGRCVCGGYLIFNTDVFDSQALR